MRFRRVGARTFLRLDKPELAHLPIFGDCGAFTYHKEDRPPYSPEDTAAFYDDRSEEHTSELQSLMRISYAVFCLKKKKTQNCNTHISIPNVALAMNNHDMTIN